MLMNVAEPKIESEDIQGHVFPGFGTTHSVVVVLRQDNPLDPSEGRKVLASLVPEVTTMSESLGERETRREAVIMGLPRPGQQKISLALAIAATTLRSWGHDTSGFDPSFDDGMTNDAKSLGDPVGDDSVPLEWQFATNEDNRADLLLIAGHSEKADLEQAVGRWLHTLQPHWKDIWIEYGRRRDGDREFFGFIDGVSQPAMRGVTSEGIYVSRRTIASDDSRSNLFAKPGQILVWPGSFLFGYPGQTTEPTQAGSLVEPPVKWMKNGSYLVFRRLLQNVSAFRNALAATEANLTEQGEILPEGWLASRLVGRWPDGTPLTASPKCPDSKISENPLRINNFLFSAALSPTPLAGTGEPPQSIPEVPADPIGKACPLVSHIRKINPRDGFSEIGTENHPGKLMLRRGITFGPEESEDPDAERGLHFLSYQTSIVNQFKFIQSNWANSGVRPTGNGLDPIIGQDGTLDNLRSIKLFAPSGRQRQCPFNGRFVVASGGGYFVAPGIAGLRFLLDIEQEA
jgi:Dyp-type peroxidase family